MEKLYKVNLLFDDCDKICELVVAKIKEQAETIVCNNYNDCTIVHLRTEEVVEVMGFKVLLQQN